MITENYIKMCEMVEGIQELWKPENGDWVFWKITNSIKIITDHFETPNLEDFIWLPTLEQLQEMMPVNNVTSLVKHIKGAELRYHDRFDKNCVGYFTGTFYSMKELWLAFVMYEKYHKSWTGKKWEAK